MVANVTTFFCPWINTYFFFFFNDTATTEIYTLSLHDALPIPSPSPSKETSWSRLGSPRRRGGLRSEEHTSELQSRFDLVCRLLLEKKNKSFEEFLMNKVKPTNRGNFSGNNMGFADVFGYFVNVTPSASMPPAIDCCFFFFFVMRPPPISTLFPYTTLFRSTCIAQRSPSTVRLAPLLCTSKRPCWRS